MRQFFDNFGMNWEQKRFFIYLALIAIGILGVVSSLNSAIEEDSQNHTDEITPHFTLALTSLDAPVVAKELGEMITILDKYNQSPKHSTEYNLLVDYHSKAVYFAGLPYLSHDQMQEVTTIHETIRPWKPERGQYWWFYAPESGWVIFELFGSLIFFVVGFAGIAMLISDRVWPFHRIRRHSFRTP